MSIRRRDSKPKADPLHSEQVAKADDGVRAIFHELLFCFIPNILFRVCKQHRELEGGEGEETCRFLAMKRDRAGDLPFSIFVGDTFRQSLLQTKTKIQIVKKKEKSRK